MRPVRKHEVPQNHEQAFEVLPVNLANYQRFSKAYWFFYKDIMTKDNTQPSYTLEGLDKSAYYNKYGITDDEEIKRHETARSARLEQSIAFGLRNAQVFDVDKVTKRLLLLTEAPTRKNILKDLKIPFPCMFFDVDIDINELPEGQYFSKDIERMDGLLVMRTTTMSGEKVTGEQVYCVGLYSGNEHSFFEDCIIPLDNQKVHYHDKTNVSVVKSLLCNLLMLMEHPEVEFRQFRRSQKNRERRVRNRELPLPDNTVIVLKGKLIRYVNEHRTILEGVGFDHSFWVRGHWRMHRADRYKAMRGRVIWVEPFLKGKGAIRQKTYSIQPTKAEERQYHAGFLWLDDIEPLSKPLSEMTDKQKNRARRLT